MPKRVRLLRLRQPLRPPLMPSPDAATLHCPCASNPPQNPNPTHPHNNASGTLAVSMLEAAIAARCTKEIVVITCARSPKVEPMHALLEAHAKACTNVSFTALYTRLTMNHVRKAAADRGFDLKSAHTFFCGPKGFMKM